MTGKISAGLGRFATVFVAVATFLVSDPLSAAEPVTIVTLGDSITKGHRAGVKKDETFSAVLEQRLKQRGTAASVVNVGIGGERTDQALERLDRDVLARDPALVVIMYGTNDSYVDQGKKASRITEAEYRDNLMQLIDRVRKAGSTPVLMTEPRWGKQGGANGLGEHPNVRLEQFMVACRNVAKLKKVPLVDNFRVWSEHEAKGTDVGTWTTDECHPNPAGHVVIADAMLPVILSAIHARSK